MQARRLFRIARIGIQRDTIAQCDNQNGISFVVVGCGSRGRARESPGGRCQPTAEQNG